MTRLILGVLLTAAIVGCTGIQPAGPFAKMGNGPATKGSKSKDKDAPPELVTVPAPKPTPPMNLVDPGDVSDDPYAAAQRLMREYEGDQKTMPALSKTAEISRIKGGVKQN